MSKTADAITIFNAKAIDYAKKYGNVEQYKGGLDILCKLSVPVAKVLDLACGPGNITKYLLSERPDFDVLGLDLAPKMISIAQEVNPNASFLVHDIKLIAELEGKFDLIIIGFGLPYLSKNEAVTLINKSYDKLNNNGLLYISTMVGNYTDSGPEKSSDGKNEMFIYYHQADYLKSMLIDLNLNIIYEKQQPFLETDKVRFTDFIVIGKK
jgi:SAM-dependent methyltransferase